MGATFKIPRFQVENQRSVHNSEDSIRGSSVQVFLSAFIAALLSTLIIVCAASFAHGADDDHIVITKKEQSFESVIQDVLQTSRFADHIASYNGVGSVTTVLPLGTTVRIPKPYIEVLNFGQIAFVKGDVTLAKTDVVVNPPGRGALVHNGDIIRTGGTGFVTVSFHSGAQFNLQPDSIVKINNVRCLEPSENCLIELEAMKGSVSSEIEPRSSNHPAVEFSITTPFLSAAVRGTVFYVDVLEGVNRVGVTRGLVAAESAGSEFQLPGGKGIAATGSDTPVEVDLLPMPVYSDPVSSGTASASTASSSAGIYSAEDSFNWQVVSGAQSYQIKVANDSAISELALLDRVESPEFSALLVAGDYFFSVAGIDDSDFVGMPLVMPIRIADIVDDVQPELRIERREGLVTVQMAGDSADYEGPVELLISNSIEAKPERIEMLDNLSEPLTLELDEAETWVFRVRKIIGPYAVSAYSNHYQLAAR